MKYQSDELCQFNYFCFSTFYCWLFLVSLLYLPLLCFYLFLHLWNCHSFPYSSHITNEQPSLIIRTSSSEKGSQIQWSDSMILPSYSDQIIQWSDLVIGKDEPSWLVISDYQIQWSDLLIGRYIRSDDRKRWSPLAVRTFKGFSFLVVAGVLLDLLQLRHNYVTKFLLAVTWLSFFKQTFTQSNV